MFPCYLQTDVGAMRTGTQRLYPQPMPYLDRHLGLSAALVRHGHLEGLSLRAVGPGVGRPGEQTGGGQSGVPGARGQAEDHGGALWVPGPQLVEEALPLEGLEPGGHRLDHRGLVVWSGEREGESGGVRG